jgi:phosphate transport system substrate-binding protein
MQHLRSRSIVLACLFAFVAIAAVFAACGDDDDNASATATKSTGASSTAAATTAGTGTIDYSKLSGEIAIDGSSTVYPITQAMAEDFGNASDVRVNVAFSGTGGGFEKFCRGEIQISDASRKIKDTETQACTANNITDVVELQVAIDGLTVVANPGLSFLDCLTTAQLVQLFKAGGATKWSDIDPTWPADTIHFYYPGTDSGTFDYFLKEVVQKTDATNNHRGDGTASEDDNVIATGVENDPNGIGYFGFAYFQEAGSRLRDVKIDGGSGCVAPTSETVLNGTYKPLSRPLFVYTRKSLLDAYPTNPVLGFLKFYLDNTSTVVPDVGYVKMTDATLAEQQAKLEPYLP